MDPRSRKTEPLVVDGALENLAERSGTPFPNIVEARELTAKELDTRRKSLSVVEHDDDTAIVLMGSWGRAELTRESDDDFMVLVDGAPRDMVNPEVEDLAGMLGDADAAPGPEEIFGVPVFSDDLRKQIGLQDDDNKNLTRRMLLVLESISATGDANWQAAKRSVIDGYLEPEIKPFRPPRFFLNDVVRYWRTIAVDFEGKHRSRAGEGWGLRNAKLRTSRKLLFASGLLPLLGCHQYDGPDINRFLQECFYSVPSDRVAAAFIAYDAIDAGARAFAAYDEFLERLNDGDWREELKQLKFDDRAKSAAFRDATEIGKRLNDALTSLLFDSKNLYPLVREFAIF